ncbi:MAG: hypothetical protein QM496_11865 [Verrucomicrobiota bacterium]
MKLYQNQLWRQGDALYRIVNLERLSVGYKKVDEAHAEGGIHHVVTKKEFCRLIKGAQELSAAKDKGDKGDKGDKSV